MERTATPEADDIQEIHVDLTEDGNVWMQTGDWDVVLSPEESRLLGQALIDAAEDADAPSE